MRGEKVWEGGFQGTSESCRCLDGCRSVCWKHRWEVLGGSRGWVGSVEATVAGLDSL